MNGSIDNMVVSEDKFQPPTLKELRQAFPSGTVGRPIKIDYNRFNEQQKQIHIDCINFQRRWKEAYERSPHPIQFDYSA